MTRYVMILLVIAGLVLLPGCGKGGVEGDMDKMEKCIKDGDLDKATELMADLAKKAEEMTDEQKAEFKKLGEDLMKAQADAAVENIPNPLGD